MGSVPEIEDRIEPAGLTYGSCVLGDAPADVPRCGSCGRPLEYMGRYGGVPLWGYDCGGPGSCGEVADTG